MDKEPNQRRRFERGANFVIAICQVFAGTFCLMLAWTFASLCESPGPHAFRARVLAKMFLTPLATLALFGLAMIGWGACVVLSGFLPRRTAAVATLLLFMVIAVFLVLIA